MFIASIALIYGIVIDSWPKNLNRNAALHVGLCFAASRLQKVCLNANFLKIMFQSCAICASNCFAMFCYCQTTRMWLQGHFRQSALCPLYAFVPLHDGTRFQKCTAFKKSAKVALLDSQGFACRTWLQTRGRSLISNQPKLKILGWHL